MSNIQRMICIAIFIVVSSSLLTVGCTQQQMVKRFGGTSTINLPEGEQLMNITWKDANMWYLTRRRPANEPIRTYRFKESSNYGINEGVVIIQEH